MPGPLALDREVIGEVCRRHGVRSLVLFGSAVTEQFDESRSDVDFLVDFKDDLPSRFDAYFGLKEELEDILSRPVDLVMPSALENPHFAAAILGNSEQLYAA